MTRAAAVVTAPRHRAEEVDDAETLGVRVVETLLLVEFRQAVLLEGHVAALLRVDVPPHDVVEAPFVLGVMNLLTTAANGVLHCESPSLGVHPGEDELRTMNALATHVVRVVEDGVVLQPIRVVGVDGMPPVPRNGS